MFEEADLQMTTHGHSIHANGMPHLNGERQPSTDRSVSSPSQNGEDPNQDLEDDGALSATDSHPRDEMSTVSMIPTQLNLQREVADLKAGFTYVSHQLTMIMQAVRARPCPCESCQIRVLQMNGIKPELMMSHIPTPTTPASAPPHPMFPPHHLASHLGDMSPKPLKMPLTPHMGQGYAAIPGGGKIGPTDRKLVAEYAKVHGAIAAAKKFGIPPPVSTYYQRKDSSSTLLAAQLSQPPKAHQSNASASPGPSSEGENDGMQAQQQMQMHQIQKPPVLPIQQGVMENGTTPQTPVTAPQTPTFQQPGSVPQSPMLPPVMMDMLKMNAAHQTGSPGFLRGRGRGRPKLIGDELDADLVEYMVTVKQADPHGHLTASQALNIAKQYILEKAPGLLDEQGGHVKLKLTWAMKLVSRIAERQKEIELGLPAGTLSNMGRHQLNNLPGGNFMADMMAQNILSQHMMMGIGPKLDENNEQQRKSMEENSEPSSGVTAPEITNVKELNLDFLNDLINGSNKNTDEGVIADDDSGEIDDVME